MKLDISVVIPAYGRAAATRRVLESLAACPDQLEVVLIDDGSPDSLEALARELGNRLDLVYVRMPRRSGPAAARNRGISAARASLIAFTDNDVVVTPTWPRELAVYLRDAPNRVAGVGGRVLACRDDVFSRYFTYHKILDPYLSEGRYLYLVTANAAFRRSALDQIGGFDESIRQPGGEDPGVAFKLLARGYELHYRREAVVFHEYRASLRDFVRTFFRYGRGCREQVDKHATSVAASAPRAIPFGGIAE